ncbi:hypothetical protein CRE_16775 [Caenorhabditis remanei]|uniref:Reverse transcriptase domain-containing protein n=1 Tax=Caenorhabditis remanei TaxID=31234 RepID=E3MAZ4_CAERE|nr:hypothetical protein CRE_16775 [Caenorhabditis remanei]
MKLNVTTAHLQQISPLSPFLPEQIQYILNTFQNNKAPGGDKVTAGFLKTIATLFTDFKQKDSSPYLKKGKVPTKWKALKIVVFKKGDKKFWRTVVRIACFLYYTKCSQKLSSIENGYH